MHELIALSQSALPYLAVGGTLAGCFLTFQYMSWRDQKRIQRERFLDNTRRQLEEFYGPMLAMVHEMRSRKEIFRSLKDGATEEYLELKKQREFRRAEKLNAEREYLAQKEIERFRTNDLPICRDMHSLFRMKGWMAEDSTREILGSMMPLLEIWELQVNRPLELKVFEKTLDKDKFFEELEADLTGNHNNLLADYQAGIVDQLNYSVKVLRTAEPPVVTAIPVDEEITQAV